MKTIRLHPGKERSLLRRHPWVFAGAIARGGADRGELVRVEAQDGRFLAWAAYSPDSQIRLRVWSFDEAQRIDAAFIAARVNAAIDRREALGLDITACRLVHGESDGLPGCIIDRYADVVVLQALAAGIERHKADIVQALRQRWPQLRLYERSDTALREREGLAPACGWLFDAGRPNPEVVISENGLRFTVNVAEGHKTGFYLDQRDARALFRATVQQHGLARVLNCFAYTGGFTLAALAGGAAEVQSVDSSAPALQRAAAHVIDNGFDPARAPMLEADVNATLRRLREAGERFDAIVLDPPKFAANPQQVERAARAYKDINRLAFHLLRPGGFLFTFSCSGGVDADLFQKIVAGAALDAGADAEIVARTGAGLDHPQRLHFPEGAYLKGLLLRKD